MRFFVSTDCLVKSVKISTSRTRRLRTRDAVLLSTVTMRSLGQLPAKLICSWYWRVLLGRAANSAASSRVAKKPIPQVISFSVTDEGGPLAGPVRRGRGVVWVPWAHKVCAKSLTSWSVTVEEACHRKRTSRVELTRLSSCSAGMGWGSMSTKRPLAQAEEQADWGANEFMCCTSRS